MSLVKLCQSGTPQKAPATICLEVNPPRGTDLDGVFKRLGNRVDGIDLFNVTDCALARMKLAALPFGAILKQRFGIDPVVNVSCRDRNVIALQADLLAGWAMGVRSVVALTGDAMTVGDSPDRKGVFEVNSVGLLNLIASLNSGKDLAGNELKGKTEYLPGVVVNPNVKNASAELKRLKRKFEAGAKYALSQPVFDEEAAFQFFSEAQSVGIPILMGLLPLKSAKAALAISNVPGIRLSESLLSFVQTSGDADLSSYFIEHCLKLATRCAPVVRGFHVISGTTPLLAMDLARELVGLVRR